ncbi:Ig-like domain-containing protein [Luteolibacter soli]|uniref:Ig-like domain-containing protein n=1 Tax=Luteolibacter soli TaxID=3135280 RepID=A0ABU9B0Q7_9BACT
MKLTSCSTGVLATCLAAALLFSATPLSAQTLTNPGFDAANFTTFPGYASGNGGAASINGWTPSPLDRVGLNPASTSPFANNGTIPSTPNVAFLQATGAATPSLSTTVSGLTIGTKYNVSVRVNARSQTPANVPHIRFSIDNPAAGPTVSAEVSAVGGTAAYRTASFEFTATATSHVITFTNTKPTVAPASSANGDHTLLLDSLTVVPSTNSWSFSPWTDDASSGVDSSYVYTHAFKLSNANTNVTINGVTFYGRQGALPGVYNLTGLTASAAFGAGVLQVTGNSATLASPFRYDGATSVTLQNLKPSTQYLFTIYGAGWDAPTDATANRASTFSSSLGGNSYTVNLNQYGKGQGIKVNYTYTTDALGSPVTISYPPLSGLSFHTSAFSNRETTPRTATSAWSVNAWHDDSDSGISPNHVYTHAQSYGTTVSPNINGVNFTGIAGVNPTGTNCSLTLPTIFNNDTNSITGYGAAMAKDFGYNGSPSVFSLSGLTAGKQYVFSIYSAGFGAGAREGAFYGTVPGEPPSILNQHTYGDNQGIRFDYSYTATAATATIMLHGITGTDTMHIYGSSNREANAMVGVAPTITLQPVGASIGLHSSYTLRGAATGSATLTYQWKRGTQDVPGATEPVLLIEDADVSDGGSYTLVVTNGVSSATSNAAVVSVLENVPGVFPTGVNNFGQALPAGATDAHYTLIVNPDNPSSTNVLVQNPIPGSWIPHSATSTWVGPRTVTNAAAALNSDAGEGPGTYVYRTQVDLTGFDVSTVQITGSWATDNSGLALRVNGSPTGITNTAGVTYGVLAPFTINSTNAPSLTAGINNIDFVVNNADAVTGYTGLRVEGLHAIGIVPLNTPPHIVVQPQGGTGPHNGVFTLGVAASGSATLSYQWYKGSNPIPDATSPTYEVSIDDLTSGGNFKVRVTNSVTFVDSNVATVTVGNTNPAVSDDNLTTDANVPLEINPVFDMFVNDTDSDGDTLTIASFSATSFNGGTITNDGGILTYTPATGYSGLDGFTYSVSDGWGGTSALGTVLITVNPAASTAPGPLTLVVDLNGNSVTGTFTGAPGATYILQRSTTLQAASWTNVDTEVAPPSGTVTVLDNDPPDVRAYYRISYTE